MEINDFISRLDNVKKSGKQYSARCPAHDDTHNSLAVTEGRDGKILVHCHAGCSVQEITSAMGLTTKELFPNNGFNSTVVQWNNAPDRKEAEYYYFDDDGQPILKKNKMRKDDGTKYFYWEYLEKGKWKKGRNKITPPLYNQKVIKDSKQVFIVEGEKDADTLRELGYEAVSLADGSSSKWTPEYTELFREKEVYIIPDNDETGRNYASMIAGNIYGTADFVKIIMLKDIWADIPEKADVSDYRQRVDSESFIISLAKLFSKTEEWNPAAESEHKFVAKTADSFEDEEIKFAWDPYIPIGDYTVLMAEGGMGKTMLCCRIAADISNGTALFGDRSMEAKKPENVLFISAEDRGSLIKKRLEVTGSNLKKIYILDCNASVDLNFGEGFETFRETVKRYKPKLVIIDPWHAFVGANVDINKINAVRPIFQKLATLAKECECGMLLVSHVNKKPQADNANNAAFGSADFINAARSAIRVIASKEPGKKDYRILVHTKSNYAACGKSIEYCITKEGGVKWAGFSDITKQTLEDSARHKCSPEEYLSLMSKHDDERDKLIKAIEELSQEGKNINISYEEMKDRFGYGIFGSYQPKKALEDISFDLTCRFITLDLGKKVKYNGKTVHGFEIRTYEDGDEDEDKGSEDTA